MLETFMRLHKNETLNEIKHEKNRLQEDLFNIKFDAEKYDISLY